MLDQTTPHTGRSIAHIRAMGALAEYKIWRGIKKRCRQVRNFPRYAGRGITVCDRWRDSFLAFYADMGPRPSPKHSVDRRDNDGHYEPNNCRWATETEQKRNFSLNRILTFDGKSMPLIAWCEVVGISEKALRNRIARGWPVELALTKPQQR